MKQSIFGLFFISVAFIMIMIAPAANAEVSIGVTAGHSMQGMSCTGCPTLGIANQTKYGIDWRGLVPAGDKLKVGVELQAAVSPSANMTAGGKNVGAINGQRFSLMPMIAGNIGKATMYAGAGLTSNDFTFKNTGGKSMSSNGNSGWIEKVGFDYPITKTMSLGLQLERSGTNYSVDGNRIKDIQHAAMARLAYNF